MDSIKKMKNKLRERERERERERSNILHEKTMHRMKKKMSNL